jgi:hypothetical protein
MEDRGLPSNWRFATSRRVRPVMRKRLSESRASVAGLFGPPKTLSAVARLVSASAALSAAALIPRRRSAKYAGLPL